MYWVESLLLRALPTAPSASLVVRLTTIGYVFFCPARARLKCDKHATPATNPTTPSVPLLFMLAKVLDRETASKLTILCTCASDACRTELQVNNVLGAMRRRATAGRRRY